MPAYRERAEAVCEQQVAQGAEERFEADVSRLAGQHLREALALEVRHDGGRHHVEENSRKKSTESTERRDRTTAQADQKYPALLAETQAKYEADVQAARKRYERQLEDRVRRQADLDALRQSWQDGLAGLRAEAEAVRRETGQLCPDWDAPAWAGWAPPAVPPGLRFGGCASRWPTCRTASPRTGAAAGLPEG